MGPRSVATPLPLSPLFTAAIWRPRNLHACKQHPLDVQSVGEDTYIVMSKGHHDLEQFMAAAIKRYPGWALGGPVHVWIKTTPGRGTYACMYNMVPEGARGAWPATYCHEYGEGYERYSGEVQP